MQLVRNDSHGPAKIIIIIKNWSSSDGTGIFLHKTLDLKFSSQESEGIRIFCGIFPSDLELDDRGHTTLLVSIFHMKATAANLLLPSENNKYD